MSMLGSSQLIMDDLVFHELWLASKKFKDYENGQTSDTENEDRDDDKDDFFSSDEDSRNVKDLFQRGKDKENRNLLKKKSKKSKSIAGNNSTEWFAVVLGIFFVASLAGLASYQAYKSDFSGELSHSNILSKDAPSNGRSGGGDSLFRFQNLAVAREDAEIPEGVYNEMFLPTSISPSAYVLYLNVDIDGKTCTGLVKITITCRDNRTSQIILNSATTTNHNVEVSEGNGDSAKLPVSEIQYNRYREMMIIKLDRNLTAHVNYSVFISFEKDLTYDGNQGFYLSNYLDGKGKEHAMASTMFEPIRARRAFPCYDEPQYKATFTIIIQHAKDNCRADSNMPVDLQVMLDGKRAETHFQTTPPMSTYLVGWELSDMVYREVMIQEDLPLRVYAPKGRLNETNMAATVAPLCVKFYENHLRINYTLPKLDLIPVTTLTSAADEVWGMIIFAEDYLLYNAKTGSVTQKELVAQDVCHEIAHQWFGDLVTMYKWNDLWLKESFASYLQTQPLEKYYHSWDIPTSTYLDQYVLALTFDSSVYTHPIYTSVTDIVKLMTIYDAITYQKGASVLEMLAEYLGEDAFYSGVNYFLEKYQFGNADATEFWQAFTKVVPDVDVLTMMNAWVKEPGYPVVLFEAVNKTHLVVRQDRFVFQNKSLVDSLTSNFSSDTIWQIPITVKYEGESNSSKMLLTTRQDTHFVNLTGVAWFKANYGATGYYSVYYGRENWLALLNVLNTNHTTLPTVDRASLLSDVAGFANYNYMTLDASLEFTLYLDKEHNSGPWDIGLAQIFYIRELFYDSPLKACFDSYIDKQISPVLDFLNSKKKHTHDELKLIPLLLTTAVAVKKQPLTDDLQRIFLEWLVRDGNVKIPTTARVAVYRAGIELGQTYEWDRLFEIFKKSTLTDKLLILDTLALTPDLNLLKRLLNYTNDPEIITGTLELRVYQSVCANPVGRTVSWEMLQKKFMMFYRENTALLWYALDSCIGTGTTAKDLEKLLNFLKKENLEDVPRLLRYVEMFKYRMELVKQYHSVTKWFRKHDLKCVDL